MTQRIIIYGDCIYRLQRLMAATGAVVPCLKRWDPNLALAVFELGPKEHVGRKCKVSFIRDRGGSAKLRQRWQQQAADLTG
jgi:hypothetical protein